MFLRRLLLSEASIFRGKIQTSIIKNPCIVYQPSIVKEPHIKFHTNMDHTITIVIDKLRTWYAGEWKTYKISQTQQSNILIRIYYDQLFILSEDKVLESLNLNSKIKGIYKDDVLILITCNSLQQIRKLKFQIKTNIAECYRKLSLHFPVVSFNHSSNTHYKAKYKNIEEALKTAVNQTGAGQPLPPNFLNFVKLCLLDPNFPNIVDEVQNQLKELDR